MAAWSAEHVTFLLTDIEGSTRVLARTGYRYPGLVAEHRAIIDAAAVRHGGAVISTQGDSCLATFPSASAALRAAVDAQRRLESHVWDVDDALRVRIGIHSGQAVERDGEYFGMDLHLAARIADAGHGGQVLVSEATRQLVAGEPLNGVRLRDLGPHRLKGLATPVRLYQVESPGLRHAFPALRARRGEAHNLPVQASPLIGRARALAEITDLLGHHSLVTLTGPGGVGKTRLALHVGMSGIDAYPDGVWLIELAAVRDARSVPALIGEPFGLELSDSPMPIAPLVEALRDKVALLILDNFEHILDAAGVVSSIVGSCPHVGMLATSRERLNLADEQVYPVPPLGLRSNATDPSSDAVTLFVDRARFHDPGFATSAQDLRDIAAICDLTDGLPLAIELAAVQTRFLSVAAVRERLRGGLDVLRGGPRDRPERHRALRNTIAWSYQLLSPDEQRLFARLSVFHVAPTVEAVGSICMDGLGIDAAEGIASLVDKSMLQRRVAADDDVKLVMLDLLAEFAKEAFAGSADADAVRGRHAAYFADLAERADAGMLGADALRWERLLNSHLEDLRAALDWAFAGGDVWLGVRIAAALHLFWYWGGPHEDGPRWVRLAMERDDELDDATRGRLDVAAGFFAFADNDMVTARRHWEASLEAYRRAGDDARACVALSYVAVSYTGDASQWARAMRLADEAVALARKVTEYNRPLAEALTCKGEIARLAGDGAVATASYREALTIARAMGDDGFVADLQSNLAYIAVREGNYVRALELVLVGLEASWKLGKPVRQAWSIGEVAGPELGLGRPERAARLLGAADAALDRMGVSWQPVDQPEHDRTLASLERVLGPEHLDALLDEGAQMTLDEAFDYALAHPEPQRAAAPQSTPPTDPTV